MILTPEHEELRRSVTGFVTRELNPHVREWEREGIAPLHDIMAKMAQLGLLGIDKSRQSPRCFARIPSLVEQVPTRAPPILTKSWFEYANSPCQQ